MQSVVPMKFKKLFLLIPNTRSQNPLDFNDVLVYSFLVFRFKYFDKDRPGLGVRQIARSTGLDKSRTIPRACSRLIILGLAEPHNGGVVAKEPVGEAARWFCWKKYRDNWPWRDRLAYFVTLVPKPKKLTPRQNCVFWLINSWLRAERRLTVAGLAKQLLISKRTVGRAIADLRKRGLLDVACKLTYTTEQKQQFWIETKERQDKKITTWSLAKNVTSLFPDNYRPAIHDNMEQLETAFQRIEKQMRAKGYSQRDMLTYWHDDVIQGCEMQPHLVEWFVFWMFDDVFSLAERITVENRAKGIFGGRNALGQLRVLTKSVLDAMHYKLNESGWNGIRSWRLDLSELEQFRRKCRKAH